MKYLVLNLICIAGCIPAFSQITITDSNMPVAGDTLRYSIAAPVGAGVNTAVTGPDMTWSFSLTPIAQGVDTYRTAVDINPLYALTIGSSVYGYKVADSIPGLGAFLPVSINQLYTFFALKGGPDRFQAQAFGANVAGFPLATNYAPPDVWYFLPLAFGNHDSSNYSLNLALPATGGIKEQGYRITDVDGWGTIQTPFYTTPVSCLRVRSEIHEIDSITYSSTTFGVPRNTVEYKWLVNESHYPALWVTSALLAGSEVITGIRYRDDIQPSLYPPDTTAAVQNTIGKEAAVSAFPVPAPDGRVKLTLPADWKTFIVELFDTRSRQVAVFYGQRELNIVNLAAGEYLARITCGSKTTYLRLEK